MNFTKIQKFQISFVGLLKAKNVMKLNVNSQNIPKQKLYGFFGLCRLLVKTFSVKTMDNIKALHEQKLGPSLRWISAKYYDYPDGQDLLGKLSFTTKIAGMVGIVHGVKQAVAEVPPITRKRDIIFMVAKSAVPAVAIAATFTCVTYYATVFRKKDDKLNYFLGGVASGTLFGAILGNKGLIFVASLALGMTGIAQKMLHDRGMKLLNPIPKRSFSSYYSRNWDFTLLPDTRRGNWTKDLPND